MFPGHFPPFHAPLIPLLQLLPALTSLSCREPLSLERHELIGDCFLKLALTCQLYRQHGSAHEFELTRMRVSLSSNAALARRALSMGLEVREGRGRGGWGGEGRERGRVVGG